MSTGKTGGRYSEICGATNRNGEPCSLPAGWGTPGSGGTRCKFHGGASTGAKDTTHLEGNDFAKDNPGGGPPIGNENSVVHGGWSDPHKFYDRLEGERKEYADTLFECYVERAKADLPEDEIREKARELSVSFLQADGAICNVFDRGWGVEKETEIDGHTVKEIVANPAVEADLRISRRERKLMRELRVYDTPDGLPWSEQ